MKSDDKLKFNAADVNKDGNLDIHEFVAFEYPYDFEYMHEVEMDRSMKELDANKDDLISQEEFDGDSKYNLVQMTAASALMRIILSWKFALSEFPDVMIVSV